MDPVLAGGRILPSVDVQEGRHPLPPARIQIRSPIYVSVGV